MPRFLKIAAVMGLVVFFVSALALYRLAQMRQAWIDNGVSAAGERPAPSAPALEIPDFRLVDQDGRPFTRDNLKGRVTIVNFAFTHCPFVCPTLMEKMEGLSIALKGERVHFLSISVDPVHDTPEALREFARLHNADPANWTLLTGEKAEVDRIVTGGLKFALTDDATNPITLPDGSVMSNIIHPSWFVLIGPDVQVKSLYRPTDPVNLEVLLDDARRLARTLPQP